MSSIFTRWQFIALVLLSVLSASPAQAYDGWVYRADLGGWLDANTGLVWGTPASDFSHGTWSWDGANNIFLPAYRNATGITAWRLPTPDELQDAYTKGARGQIVFPANDVQYVWFWSSQVHGKNAWMSNWKVGGGGFYFKSSSYINAIPVYRAFVP